MSDTLSDEIVEKARSLVPRLLCCRGEHFLI